MTTPVSKKMTESADKHEIAGHSTHAEDAELVAQVLKGKMAAYDLLVERYQRRGVSVAYRLLGNLSDAMDVVQDAFLRGYKSIETLENHERFGPWMMRIVSNLALNFRRGRRKHLSLSMGGESDESQETGIPDEGRRERSGAAAMESAELKAKIDSGIESLPEAQRLALILFAIEEMPQKDVAEIMECSVEMVKWNVFQARKTLKARLADYLEE